VRVMRLPAETPHLVGPARTIGELPDARRRIVVSFLFLAAVVTVLACADPFAQSLVDVGHRFNIDDFVLISLVAPLASEAPELLVGSLPIVFAISSSSLHGLPIDAVQREELFVTAAQSAFAVAVLANRKISVREASIMLGLLAVQVLTKLPLFDSVHGALRVSVGVVYLVLAAGIVFRQRRAFRPLLRDGLIAPVGELAVIE